MSPPEVVQQIRQEIFEETQLTASAGILEESCDHSRMSFNTFV